MNNWQMENIRSVISVTILVALIMWESLAPFFVFFARTPRKRLMHGARNLVLGVFNATANAVICVGLWWVVARWAESNQFGLLHWLHLPSWSRLIALFLLVDLWMYAWHRLNHRVPLFWRFHRVHHSDTTMDVTTASRFHVGEIVLSCVLRVPVIALLGVTIRELVMYELAMFTVVQLHHANIALPGNMDRWMRWIIVSPFMHKIHHSDWQPETDSNYASLFSFWDRIFRTYRTRKDPHQIQFGLKGLEVADHDSFKGIIALPFKKSSR